MSPHQILVPVGNPNTLHPERTKASGYARCLRVMGRSIQVDVVFLTKSVDARTVRIRRHLWIPKAMLHPTNTVRKKGDVGTIVVKRRYATRMDICWELDR